MLRLMTSNGNNHRKHLLDNRKPWQHELDWWSQSAGKFHMLAIRDGLRGFWRGYVGWPKDWAIDVDALIAHGDAKLVGDLDHSGGRVDYVYVEFHCNHARDYSPKDYTERVMHRLDSGTYRTLGYVQAECRDLVRQVQAQRVWYTRLSRWIRRLFTRQLPTGED